MDKNYLLTYQRVRRYDRVEFAETTFSWFDTEEEMDEFIEKNKKIHIINMIKIISAKNLME